MSKSPLAVAQTALEAARQAMPAYSHPNSPHKYTQHQLFACLVLKEFLKTDFRGLAQMLEEWSDLREALGLKEVPDFSTFSYARRRLLKKGAFRSFMTAR
jgi:hypothetical protein